MTSLLQRMPSPKRLALLVVLSAVFWPAIPRPNTAAVIILKDGYTLHGVVASETTTIIDPASGQAIPIKKMDGFYMISDNVRRIIFSERQLLEVDDKDLSKATDIITLYRGGYSLKGAPLLPFSKIDKVTEWDAKWQRAYHFTDEKNRPYQVNQHIFEMRPDSIRVETGIYSWRPRYFPQELGVDKIRSLLYAHPDLEDKGGKVDPDRRLKISRFLMQAGWYKEADQELDKLLKDLPNDKAVKEKVESQRDALNKERYQKAIEELERAQRTGRHRSAQEQLKAFPAKGVEDKVRAKVRELEAKYDTARLAWKQGDRLLKELPLTVERTDQKQFFTEVCRQLRSELTLDSADRLEAFVTLAMQAERDRANGRAPKHSPAELLSLAVSGWLLGNSSAETKVEMAQKLWQAREFVLKYQRATRVGDRGLLLDRYQKSEPLPFDEMAQLIKFLPPPEPYYPKKKANNWWTWWKGVDWQTGAGTDPIALEVQKPSKGRGAEYLVQLPVEYHHHRSVVEDPREGPRSGYPVLIVLNEGGERPKDMLQRWSELAARHGYILVAPTWERNLGGVYTYHGDDHAAVLDVIQDLRRRFAVDSDRVFLSGFGEGGNMAYDVGLSHPDQFAGVIPIGARPRMFSQRYRSNGRLLPFYAVASDMGPDEVKLNRQLYIDWVGKAHPSLLVEYMGRPHEWFAGELPYIFDWMSRQKRANPITELSEYTTMRQTDNRFYWLSTDAVDDRNINDPDKFIHTKVPAFLTARIFPDGNRILVNTRGVNQVTIWLREKMIDFQKPVTIQVNTTTFLKDHKVVPSLATLLEDFCERGDRQRLYVAKLEFKLRK